MDSKRVLVAKSSVKHSGNVIDDRWRKEYQGRRYLENLSDDELRQRGHAIFRNFMTINAEGKSSPLSVNHRLHAYWRRRFNHFLEECEHRFGPYPSGLGTEFIEQLKFPRPTSPRVLAAREKIGQIQYEEGKYLVKFGQRKYLEEMLHEGIVRISPASAFSDASFNDAIRDTELDFSFHLYKPTMEDVQPYMAGLEVNQEMLDGSAIVSETAKEDFYIYCLGATYDVCLFDDFEADACLVITDLKAFIDKLLWTVHHAVDARGHTFSPVTYVDPMTETGKGVHLALRKNAYYSYQDEVRGVWLSNDKSKPLSVQFVSLGSLEEIAHLIELKTDA